MQSLYRIPFFLFGCFFVQLAHAQTQPQTQPLLRDTVINPVQRDTTGFMPLDTVPVTSLSPELLNIYNQTAAKKYKIADIKVTGKNTADITSVMETMAPEISLMASTEALRADL